MHTISEGTPGASKADAYRHIYSQLSKLLSGEQDFLANSANTAALLFQSLPDVSWLGFYFFRDGELVLGPFQGPPACTRITMGEGVCGAAAATRESIVVRDVSKFEGHIACDPVAKSEIVVPLLNWGRLIGVLDVDSASLNRFDDDDCEGLEALMSMFVSVQKTDDLPDFEQMASQIQA